MERRRRAEGVAVGRQCLIRVGELGNAAVPAAPGAGLVPEIGEELRGPREIVGAGSAGIRVRQRESAEKVLREGQRPGEAVDTENFTAELLILIAGGEKAGQVAEAGIVLFIPPEKHSGQHVLLQELLFIVVGEDAEVRIDVEQVEILTEHGLAEGVDGGDGGAAEEGELPLEPRRAAGIFLRGMSLQRSGGL